MTKDELVEFIDTNTKVEVARLKDADAKVRRASLLLDDARRRRVKAGNELEDKMEDLAEALDEKHPSWRRVLLIDLLNPEGNE